MRRVWIATPSLLVASCQAPPNTSTAATCAGAKMWVLDRDFALCTPLKLLAFLGGFVGAQLVGWRNSIFNACTAVFFRLRVLPRSLQRSEQNRCWRACRATSRPQLAQTTGASRRRARVMVSPFL